MSFYDIIFSYQNARTKNNDFNIDFESEWVFTEHQAEALAINICIPVPEIWLIYIVAIPLQVLDVLWFAFRKV